MIVVRVELHSAVTGHVTTLGEAIIFNDGTGTSDRGNYTVRVARKGGSYLDAARLGMCTRDGRVENYPRLRYTVWRLVLRALRACYPEEK